MSRWLAKAGQAPSATVVDLAAYRAARDASSRGPGRDSGTPDLATGGGSSERQALSPAGTGPGWDRVRDAVRALRDAGRPPA